MNQGLYSLPKTEAPGGLDTSQYPSGALPVVNRMKRLAQFFFCAMLLSSVMCSAQTIAFRVITDDGKPLEKKHVTMTFELFDNGKFTARNQTQETDRNGEARFTLPSSTRDFFFFNLDLGSPYWHCGCGGGAKIQTVVQTGIVQSAASKDSESAFTPKPDEILVVARKFTLIERLFYPLMKD